MFTSSQKEILTHSEHSFPVFPAICHIQDFYIFVLKGIIFFQYCLLFGVFFILNSEFLFFFFYFRVFIGSACVVSCMHSSVLLWFGLRGFFYFYFFFKKKSHKLINCNIPNSFTSKCFYVSLLCEAIQQCTTGTYTGMMYSDL